MSTLSPQLRAAYLELLEKHYAMRASASHVSDIDTTILDLLASTSYKRPEELYDALAAGLLPYVLETLAASMTIGETHFFRVTPQIEALRNTVLPELVARHATDRRLRMWSAGCSTGEEAYTLAMLVSEQIVAPQAWDIQLIGTDLNRAALDVARVATYGEWSFRETSELVRQRYFTPVAGRWQLNAQVRRMVKFAQHNLVEDPIPFSAVGERPDLILCRNVTIYFNDDSTQRLYRRFGDALEPASWLILGPSDPSPTPTSGFEMVALGGALMWRRRTAVAPLEVRVDPVRAAPTAAAITQRTLKAKAQPSTARAPARVTPPGPMDWQAYLATGMLQLEQGAIASAIDNLRRAAYLHENSALVQFSLGRAYRAGGAVGRSRSAFLHARRLLAGVVDDEAVAGDEVRATELREAIQMQLADLDRTA